MSNNTPDYNEDLAFKPEFTWKELCGYAKSKGALIGDGNFEFENLTFFEDGDITFSEGFDGFYYIARKRTYEQMKTIIEALWG